MPAFVCSNSMTRSWNNKVALDLLQQVLNKIYSILNPLNSIMDSRFIFVKKWLYKVIVCNSSSLPISFTIKMKKETNLKVVWNLFPEINKFMARPNQTWCYVIFVYSSNALILNYYLLKFLWFSSLSTARFPQLWPILQNLQPLPSWMH